MSTDSLTQSQKHLRQDNAMSAITSNMHEDLKPAVPVFSYAQAAKGKGQSTQPSQGPSRSTSDTPSADAKQKLALENATAPMESKPVAEKNPEKNPVTESQIQSEDAAKGANSDQRATGEIQHNAGIENGRQTAVESSLSESQPDVNTGIGSANTIIKPAVPAAKEKVETPATNGSTDGVADPQSSDAKTEERKGEDEVVSTTQESSWDEQGPAPLKDAPPPPVNFWAQRMAQTPKSKPSQPPTPQVLKPISLTNGTVGAPHDSAKANEFNHESRRQDVRRKGRNGAEEKPAVKDAGRASEAKPRGAEATSKFNSASVAPPPPGDAVSWPTPESAVEEEKKKAQERLEKDKNTTASNAKPHSRKEWQHVPFVPTVNFNTPLPQARRGGRPPPGASREGGPRGRNNNIIDKSTSTSGSPTGQSLIDSDERARALVSSPSTATNPPKQKRASSAGPTSIKEQRRPGDSLGADRRREFEAMLPKISPSKPPSQPEQRRQSATASSEASNTKATVMRGSAKDVGNVARKPQNQNGDEDRPTGSTAPAISQPHRGMDAERKSDTSIKTLGSTRDTNPSLPPRERGEGRSDRGRGSYRGRGGGNQHMHNGMGANGHNFGGAYPAPYPPAGGAQARSFSNHERLASTPQSAGPYYTAAPTGARSHRSNSRSQSIPHPYGRFSHGPHTGPHNLPNLQTDLANAFAYQQPELQGPMSAMPFNPFLPGTNLFGMVTVQMEYYFSVDNLCKDTFLRGHMNSQGFVPFTLVAGFRRIQQLTPDLELVRYVCLNSHVIEFLVGDDGTDWIRRRDDWQQWVLNAEERVPSAQNDGPLPAPYTTPQMYSAPAALDDRQELSPRSSATAVTADNVQYQSLDNAANPTGQVSNHSQAPPNGPRSNSRVPLSAAVSEFSPSVRSPGGRMFSSPDPYSQGINIITDEEMEKLNITFRAKPSDVATPVLQPFHSASSRTFSNGSIDGNSITSELAKFNERQQNTPVNGDSPEGVDPLSISRSRSPFSMGSPSRKAATTSSPSVLWFKDKEHQARMHTLPSEYTHAAYPVFRQSALGQRERLPTDPCVYDMQVLYDFWAHYLIRNFNENTYKEFRQLATEDDEVRKSNFGMRCLLQFYSEALLGQRTVPSDAIAIDFADIVKKESPTSDRPVFKRLRGAWRNGAFNHKNRAKIIKVIDTDLRTELDK